MHPHTAHHATPRHAAPRTHTTAPPRAGQVPDVYGVFKYVIDYSRQGYSHIALQQVVPVRPLKHDEYERFLVAAYPYYASLASTMAAFLLLGAAFLYSS
jgi:oligosaccharyltransferase complex subunit beta